MSRYWRNLNELGAAKSLSRQYGVVFQGRIFSGSTASDGETVVTAASFPSAELQRFSTASGIFQASSESGGTKLAIYRSPDGFTAYAKVLDLSTSYADAYPASLVDCGGGKLFFLEYGPSAVGSRLYYSIDGGATWGDNHPDYDDGDPLFITAVGSIRHWHGGKYDPAYDRLYLFTGDADDKSSILWSDDIDHVAANPATWKTRWGLDDSSRTGIDDDWVVGRGDQSWRTLDCWFHGDYMYWGADTQESSGQRMRRAHRVTHESELIPALTFSGTTVLTRALGEVWTWGLSPNGVPLVCTSGVTGTGADGHMRVYALDPGGASLTELLQVERTDIASPSGVCIPHRIDSIGDYVVISNRLRLPNVIGQVATSSSRPLSSQLKLRLSQAYLVPVVANPWGTRMKTGIVDPAYNASDTASYVFGPRATTGTPAGNYIWNTDKSGLTNSGAGSRYFAGNRLPATPGVRTITTVQTYWAYYQQDVHVTSGRVEVWRKNGANLELVAYSDERPSRAATDWKTHNFTPTVPLTFTVEAGMEYYAGVSLARLNSVTTVPYIGRVGLTGTTHSNLRLAIGADYDLSSGVIPFAGVAGSVNVRQSTDFVLCEVSYKSDQCTEVDISTLTVATGTPVKILVPRLVSGKSIIKLSDAVVADAAALAIGNHAYSTTAGTESANNTTTLDCGATDRILDGGNAINLPSIGGTPQAAQPFRMYLAFGRETGKGNTLWQCRSLESTVHSHASEHTSAPGSLYTYAAPTSISLTGDAAIARLQVGVKPVVLLGDGQTVLATGLENEDGLGGLGDDFTKPRVSVPMGTSTATVSNIATLFASGAEVCGWNEVVVLCGLGVRDAIAASTASVSDAKETVSEIVAAIAGILDKVAEQGALSMVVGLPPYSDASADEYEARIVRWLNRAYLGMSLALKIPFYNPWPDIVLSSSRNSSVPVFTSAWTADAGLHYSAAGGAIVRPKVVEAFERAAIDLRDAW